MKVCSKYDIGDNVWYMAHNKVQSCTVMGVKIVVGYNDDEQTVKNTVEYFVGGGSIMPENILYSSKKELVKSL